MPKIDEAADRYGDWTLIEDAGRNRHYMQLVRARCSCGSEATLILSNLKAGVSRGCQPCALARARADHGWGGKKATAAAKLTIDQVREIKSTLRGYYKSLASLAREYGVSVTQIVRIRDGKAWPEVE